jgi:hypothetical protein
VNSIQSAAGIAISYWLDDRGVGVRVSVGSKIFSSLRRPDRLWGPFSLLSDGYQRVGTSTGITRPGREANH